MKLTVLGCFSPYPPAGGAGPGYLLTHEGTKVLLDCGSGVVSRLSSVCNFRQGELSAIVLSHLHADHFCDLLVLRYAHFRTMQEGKAGPLPVFTPAEPSEERNRIAYRDILSMTAVGPETKLELGGMAFEFCTTNHAIPCLAVRVTVDNKSLVYTGDTAWDEQLVQFCSGADVLLAEASFLHRDKGANIPKHLSALECGELAARAGVKSLIITHLWPEYDPEHILAEAKSAFAGDVAIAHGGLEREV